VIYLLDTNVVSEPGKSRPDPTVTRWLQAVPTNNIRISVLVIGQIRCGVESVRRRDPSAGDRLDSWFDTLLHDFRDQLVPVSTEIADLWGRLILPDRLPEVDGLLAATALAHNWTIVTRNVKDFERTGVRLLNPFSD